MPNTYTELLRTTVGTATSSVTLDLTGISGYTDLRMVISGITTVNGYAFTLGLNGDTGSNYSQTLVTGSGSAAQSARYSNATNTSMYLGGWNAGYDTTYPNTILVDFMNYPNTTTYKTILWREGAASRNVEAGVILWRGSTGSATQAITSINVYAQSGSNIAVGSTFSLYGIANADQGAAKATGGIITEDSQYWYHTFGASSAFIPKQSLTCDVLQIAGGGGGGGAYLGGGGGAGGLRAFASQSFTATTYNVTVGGGGAGGTALTQTKGTSGSTTTFNSLSVSGGGGGGSYGSAINGVAGGSGGGGSGDSASSGGAGNTGSYSPVEGYAGGGSGGAASQYGAGGGGGASAVGAAGTGAGGGAGGAGTDTYNSINFSSWLTATTIGSLSKVAGGGGGAAETTFGVGGVGGGGAGGNLSSNGQGVAGLTNSGSGGGGSERGGGTKPGGNGGSGVVIIRYAK
jgi:hypothetical protein